MLKHGEMCKGKVTAEAKIWIQMHERCRNPNKDRKSVV